MLDCWDDYNDEDNQEDNEAKGENTMKTTMHRECIGSQVISMRNEYA